MYTEPKVKVNGKLRQKTAYLHFKRVQDVVLSVLGLVLLFPFMLIIALIIILLVLVLGIAAFFVARALISERDSEDAKDDVSVERELDDDDEDGVIDRSEDKEEARKSSEDEEGTTDSEQEANEDSTDDGEDEKVEEPEKEVIHTYEVFSADYSWLEAKNACEEMGGYLATITSAQEYEEICNLAEASGLTYLWLGAKVSPDIQEWGDGCWITDEQWTFEKWYPGEPSKEDADGTKENYLCLWNAKYDGEIIGWTFNDQRNDIVEILPSTSGSVGFVCEFETEVD